MTKKEIHDRNVFTHKMLENYPGIALDDVRRLIRLSVTWNRLQVCVCNGAIREKLPSETWDQYDKSRREFQIPWIEQRGAKLQAQFEKIEKKYGIKINLSGDPRGYCAKIILPDGSYNSWGGAECGYGIPCGQ